MGLYDCNWVFRGMIQHVHMSTMSDDIIMREVRTNYCRGGVLQLQSTACCRARGFGARRGRQYLLVQYPRETKC